MDNHDQSMVDFTNELGVKAAKRLQEEYIIWLTTVSPSGVPQPNPVWFYWDGKILRIYSQPSSHKMRNISRNPKVSLNFHANEDGGDIVVLAGTASIERHPPQHDPRYLQKYRNHIPEIGLTPESFAKSYSVLITITPDKLRGF